MFSMTCIDEHFNNRNGSHLQSKATCATSVGGMNVVGQIRAPVESVCILVKLAILGDLL